MALRCLWRCAEPQKQGFVRLKGDALGVLAAFVKRSAASPLLNKVVKEVAWRFAFHFASLETLHVWNER